MKEPMTDRQVQGTIISIVWCLVFPVINYAALVLALMHFKLTAIDLLIWLFFAIGLLYGMRRKIHKRYGLL